MNRHGLPNPLRDLHEQADAEFQAYAELEVVSTFGEPQAEYSAIRKGCGMLDLPQRGVLELTGRDRLAFLNNLLTNNTWDKSRTIASVDSASAGIPPIGVGSRYSVPRAIREVRGSLRPRAAASTRAR